MTSVSRILSPALRGLIFGMMVPGVLAARQTPAGAAGVPAKPTRNYWVYVGAESADLIHRIRFGPAGLEVEKTIPVGELPAEMEGPPV